MYIQVPFVDLRAQYACIKAEIDAAIARVLADAAFIRGKYVEEFERAYAEAHDVRHCIGVGNGTDALYIGLRALGIGPGDEVLVPALTWISTAETVSLTGARPVFVDIEPEYYAIDPRHAEAKITERTKAIVPVHLYGQPADMGPLLELAQRYGLVILEDCAQAHFARYRGRLVGTFGALAAFSFYPSKNLGAFGDGGALLTDDDALARFARIFANHGSLTKHEHEIEGINSRLDGLQAAILSVKLPYVHRWNQQRAEHAQCYAELLADVEELVLPRVRPNCTHVFHLFVIRTRCRDELQKFLAERGIQTQLHYPRALPFVPAYQRFRHRPEDFPIAWQYQQELLSLPLIRS
ncbi:MAG: DegT/DnrJ/EryC1/StrS family aminotransferase [Bacteroidota bacterium]|nr:DegT/DnrJ/EryC1/StrS family aminotransferase [Bacteroidota bacterium]